METAATSQQVETSGQQTLVVGKDHLTISDYYVIIDAAYEITDWQVREYQRMPIFLGEFKFFLRQKIEAQPPFAMRYLLERWPEDADFDAAPFSFTYDEQFVLERDAEHARNEKYDRLGRILMCVYPLLGFLWAGTKKKLIPAGIVPRSVTSVSIFTCVCLMLLQGTFIRMQLGLFTLLFGRLGRINFGWLVLDYALLGLMVVDSVLRFDQHLKAIENPWGFCEWVTKPFRRKQEDDEEQKF